MKVIYVTTGAPFGGGETFALVEANALRQLGHVVRFVPLRKSGAPQHASGREALAHTDAEPLLSWRIAAAALRELARTPLRTLEALALLMTWRPRRLLANLAVFPKALWLAQLVRRRAVDHIHAYWATAPAALAMAAAHCARVPWSFTAHRHDVIADDLLERKARAAEFTRVVCADGARTAAELGAPEWKLHTLHLGVEIPPVPRPTHTHSRTLRLLCPARLSEQKDHACLLEALARVRAPVLLWLAGDGPLRADIERRAARLGLRNVRLLGAVPHERLLHCFASGAIDAVVLTSRHEGVPVALMEAMAAGVPAIATRVGGIAELLGDDAGLLVPAGDAAAVADAIDRLATDPALRRQLGAAGRARVTESFSVERTAAELARRFAATLPSREPTRAVTLFPRPHLVAKKATVDGRREAGGS